MHPKDDELIPIGTEVTIIRGFNKGKKAVIKEHDFQFNGRNFLNYRGTIEGREGLYALYHSDIIVNNYL